MAMERDRQARRFARPHAERWKSPAAAPVTADSRAGGFWLRPRPAMTRRLFTTFWYHVFICGRITRNKTIQLQKL